MNSPLPPDPYEALSVPKDAQAAIIKAAHRKLVLLTHPDKFPDESLRKKKADEFHRIQQAYELLSDENRRRDYDDQVKLAKLRRERFGDRIPPQTTRVEVRTAAPPRDFDRGYSSDQRDRERRPPRPFVEEEHDYFAARKDRASASSRYETVDSRYTPRRFDDRKAARAADDRLDRDRIERERVKEEDRARMAEKKKYREKDRRKVRDEKSFYPTAGYFDGDDDDSDRRRPLFGEMSSRKSVDETSSRRHARSSDERLPKESMRRRADDDTDRKVSDAKLHMERSSRSASAQVRPAAPHRSPASFAYASPPSSPIVVDTARRSHARRGPERERMRSSGKSRGAQEEVTPENIEIVEPPASYDTRSRVVPMMPTSTSSPSSIKLPRGMPQPQRSATFHSMQHPSDADIPDIRPLGRSTTSPMADTSTRRRDAGSSKRRPSAAETFADDDYANPRSAGRSASSYADRVSSARSHPRGDILVEEEGDSDSSYASRDRSPHTSYPTERARPGYSRGSSTSSTIKYVYSEQTGASRRPSLRQETSSSSRVPSSLRRDLSPPSRGQMPPLRKESTYGRGYDVQYSPRYKAEDINFSDDHRRKLESVY
ncbi:MAG: hypothetical protein M4579_005325 [Chaenotheca gracillima]|nr:MAG: hypothetical protein M4579_005325 [Chaenotheca gracillima]